MPIFREGQRLGRKWNPCGCIKTRYLFVMMGSLGFVMLYALRFNLSVAIVSMVRPDPNNTGNGLSYECINHTISSNSSTSNESEGEFDWDPYTQGLILSSFFWGYVVTQLPGGRLAEHFGAKYLLGICIFGTSVFTILSPAAARIHYGVFMACRIVEGLFEGLAYPVMHHMIAEWLPSFERSFLSSIIYSGAQVGTVITLPLAGYLSNSGFLGGWPSVFYTLGVAGILWSIAWVLLVYETPKEHPFITKEELKYILDGQKEGRAKLNPKVPWKSILTSVPVYALILAHLGHNFGFYLLLTQLPTYFRTILGFDIKKNGLLSALPSFVQAICAILSGFIFDKLIIKNILTTNTVRKVANTIGVVGPGVCLLLVVWIAKCDATLSVILFALSMALDGCVFSGFVVTHVDMSPDFAGTLMGITNFVSNFAGIAAPYVVGVVTQNEVSLERWSYCFYLASAIYFSAAAIFIFFGSARLQEWGLATHEPCPNGDMGPDSDEQNQDKFQLQNFS